MTNITASISLKSNLEDSIVEPDTLQPLKNGKKPKIDCNADPKYKCIKSIVEMYKAIVAATFTPASTARSTAMDIDTDGGVLEDALNNITVGNYAISIIFKTHNVCRQETKTGVIKATTSFKILYKGKDYPLENDSIKATWIAILKNNDLEYKNFGYSDSENWYVTMGPCLEMFSLYPLRVNELRLGHNHMPITQDGCVYKGFPVSKYRLSGAHHVLLEGVSYPPARKASFVQCLGPMTAWLCMLRGEGIYRNKYATAVKKAMPHVPCIGDIIDLTRTTTASEIAYLTVLVAEILLATTSRQKTRMFFPITVFTAVWNNHEDTKKFCEFFRSTGEGGWYTYKVASALENKFTINGHMEPEKASQIVFHGIFGSYKEDLSILSQTTDISLWYTKEEMGPCFRQQDKSDQVTKIQLPKLKYYSKTFFNQTGHLSKEYNQVATVPCFSGYRVQKFNFNSFEHLEKKRIMSDRKSLSGIIRILVTTLEELHDPKKEGGIDMGTTNWIDMTTLGLNTPGEKITLKLKGHGKMF
jgi:hypothetical protein